MVSCEKDNGALGFMKDAKYSDYLWNYQLANKGSAPCACNVN